MLTSGLDIKKKSLQRHACALDTLSQNITNVFPQAERAKNREHNVTNGNSELDPVFGVFRCML